MCVCVQVVPLKEISASVDLDSQMGKKHLRNHVRRQAVTPNPPLCV